MSQQGTARPGRRQLSGGAIASLVGVGVLLIFIVQNTRCAPRFREARPRSATAPDADQSRFRRHDRHDLAHRGRSACHLDALTNAWRSPPHSSGGCTETETKDLHAENDSSISSDVPSRYLPLSSV